MNNYTLNVDRVPLDVPWTTNEYRITGRVYIGKKEFMNANAYVVINTDDDYRV